MKDMEIESEAVDLLVKYGIKFEDLLLNLATGIADRRKVEHVEPRDVNDAWTAIILLLGIAHGRVLTTDKPEHEGLRFLCKDVFEWSHNSETQPPKTSQPEA